MTMPVGDAPDGAWVWGTVHDSQNYDDPSVRAEIRSKALPGYVAAQDTTKAKWSGFTSIASFLDGLSDAFEGSSSGGGFFDRFFNHSQAQAVAQVVLENKVEALLSGGTRSSYAISGTWTNPGPGKTVGVACISGGQGGARASSAVSVGGEGGVYVYKEFKSEDLPSTVAVTVGAGGAGRTSTDGLGSLGTASSFGTFLMSAPGITGGIITPEGVIMSGGNAGTGGNGYGGSSFPGSNGTGNPLALGGVYDQSSITGAPGEACPTDGVAVAGGGGGAGAGNGTALQTVRGGAGGWPGGGGGGVGIGGTRIGGAGAAGAVFVTVKG